MKYILALLAVIPVVSHAYARSILDLGHTTEIVSLNSSGSFLASQDSWNYWSVWNVSTKQLLLSGHLDTSLALPRVGLKDSLFVVPVQGGFNVFTLPDIMPQYVRADSADNVQLTSDGRFIWSGSTTGLRVWSATGQEVLKLDGNYGTANVASDSLKVFVAVPGADSMNVYFLSNGNDRSTIHFDGAFHSWLLDGERFITLQGSIVRTYSAAGVREAMQDIGMTTGLAGNGSYFWTYPDGIPDYKVKIYRVGTSVTPVKTIEAGTLAKIIGRNGYIGILPYGVDTFTVCKLEQDTVTVFSSKGSGAYLSSFECSPQGEWFTGNKSGVINHASSGRSPQYLNYGRIRALASTPEGKLAAATSSGQILIFQIRDETSALIDSFAHNSSSLKFSSDGAHLASGSNATDNQYSPDRSLIVFDCNDHSIIRQWNYSISVGDSYSFIQDFDLSKNGAVVSQMIGTFVTRITYSAAQYDISSGDSARFQKSNYQMAPQLNSTGELSAHWADSTVKLYKDSVLINAFSGDFGGWYNDSQFIINKYSDTTTSRGTFKKWVGTFLVDSSGRLDSSLHTQKELFKSTAITDTEMFCADYWPASGSVDVWSIYNMHSGEKVFSTNTLSGYFRQSLPIPVGSDFIVYQNATSVDIMNWRQNQLAIHSKSALPSHERNGITINNATLCMKFTVHSKSSVRLSLFTINGALVSSVELGSFTAGGHYVSVPQSAVVKNGKMVHTPLVAVIKTESSVLASRLVIKW